MANSNDAFASAKPLEGNVSDWIAGQEKMDFAYRAEQREVAKIAQEKKDKDQLDYEKRLEKFKPFDIAATKVKSVDEVGIKLLLRGKEEQLKIFKELKPGISVEKHAELTARQRVLDNAASYFKYSSEAFLDEANNLKEKIEKGEVIPTDSQLKLLKSFSNGSFDVDFDNDMKPMMAIYDMDGDGKPDIMPYDKIVNKQVFGELIPKMDFTTSFQTIGQKLGSVKTGTDSGFVENTKLNTPIKFAQNSAKAALYDESGNYTGLAKSYLMQKKGYQDFKNIPEKVLDEMENEAVQIMLATRNTEDITKVDYGAQNTAIKNASDAKKDEKDKVTWGVVETPPIYKESGISPAKGYKTIAVQGKTSIPALSFGESSTQNGKTTSERKNITNGQLQSYTVKTNSFGVRQIVAEIVYQDEKSKRIKDAGLTTGVENLLSDSSETTTIGESKETKVLPLTEKDAKIFAIQLGFKNVNEMKDAARSGAPTTVQGIGSKY